MTGWAGRYRRRAASIPATPNGRRQQRCHQRRAARTPSPARTSRTPGSPAFPAATTRSTSMSCTASTPSSRPAASAPPRRWACGTCREVHRQRRLASRRTPGPPARPGPPHPPPPARLAPRARIAEPVRSRLRPARRSSLTSPEPVRTPTPPGTPPTSPDPGPRTSRRTVSGRGNTPWIASPSRAIRTNSVGGLRLSTHPGVSLMECTVMEPPPRRPKIVEKLSEAARTWAGRWPLKVITPRWRLPGASVSDQRLRNASA